MEEANGNTVRERAKVEEKVAGERKGKVNVGEREERERETWDGERVERRGGQERERRDGER